LRGDARPYFFVHSSAKRRMRNTFLFQALCQQEEPIAATIGLLFSISPPCIHLY
jgi:hypothetical protein